MWTTQGAVDIRRSSRDQRLAASEGGLSRTRNIRLSEHATVIEKKWILKESVVNPSSSSTTWQSVSSAGSAPSPCEMCRFPQRCCRNILEAFWPYMNFVEVIRVCATAKEFNDAKKFIPHAKLYLFFLRNMRCGTDQIEPRRESIESQSFFVSPLAKFEEARRLLNRRQGLKIAPFRDHQILRRDTLVRCVASKHRNFPILTDIVFVRHAAKGDRALRWSGIVDV